MMYVFPLHKLIHRLHCVLPEPPGWILHILVKITNHTSLLGGLFLKCYIAKHFIQGNMIHWDRNSLNEHCAVLKKTWKSLRSLLKFEGLFAAAAQLTDITQQYSDSPHVCLLFLYLDYCHHLFIVLHWGIIYGPCNPPGDGVLQWRTVFFNYCKSIWRKQSIELSTISVWSCDICMLQCNAIVITGLPRWMICHYLNLDNRSHM